MLPFSTLALTALQRADRAVADFEVCEFKHRASFPRYAAITFGIVPDLIRGPFGDLLAVVEHGNALADAHDDLHVVLDEQNGEAEFLLREPDQLHQLAFLRRVHAGGGFVEQEQLRPRRQGADDFEAALVAVGQGTAG